MTQKERKEQAKDRASACADAIQLQLGLEDWHRVAIERLLSQEFDDAMREAAE